MNNNILLIKMIGIIFIITYVAIAADLYSQNIQGEQVVPSDIEEELKLGEQCFYQRKYSAALQHFKRVTELDPQNIEALMNIAKVYEQRKEYTAAMNQYHEVLSLDSTYYDAFLSMYQIRLHAAEDESVKTNLKDEIKNELRLLLHSRPLSDSLYALAYFVYDDLAEPTLRDEFRQKFLKYFPDSDKLDEIGQTAFEQILRVRESKDRVVLAERFIHDFPKHPQCNTAYRIVLRYYSKDAVDTLKVEEICAQWVKRNPEDVMSLYISSKLFSEMNILPDKALQWAIKAVSILKQEQEQEIAPWADEPMYRDRIRLYEALDNLGYVYLTRNELMKAEQYIKKSLELFEFNERANLHLAMVYRKKDRIDDAMRLCVNSLMCRTTTEANDMLDSLMLAKYNEIIEGIYQRFAQQKNMSYFIEVTADAGLSQANGSRIAWGDYDNDGYDDILLNGSKLWRNNGDGTFQEITEAAEITGSYSGGLWADYDNDGHLDFFSIGIKDALWRNNGDGSFTDVTVQVGNISDGYPTEGAAWSDYDRDGYVDIYLANYEAKELAEGTPDILWKNIAGKNFENVNQKAGIISEEDMCGRGVCCADYNDDGYPDIFVSNYRLDPNCLWQNNGDCTFTNVAAMIGVEGIGNQGYYGHTIGACWADYDNDNDLDIFQANLAHPRYIEFSNMSYLLNNSGPPHYEFTDYRKYAGIRFEETHSDPSWCDYDNDGYLDLYITSVYPHCPSFLYHNDGTGKFTDVTWLTGTRVEDGWGCAWSDYDNDGDMDLAVCASGKLRLFRNELDVHARHWLKVKLISNDCNRSAIGARIKVTAGKLVLVREVQAGEGTTHQNSLTQHFGLGGYNQLVEIEIRWPCGKLQNLHTEVNRLIKVTEP